MGRSEAAEPDKPEFCLFSRRNNSLTDGQRRALFGSLATVSIGVATAFAAAGAWMILPYSLAELGALFWAFRFFERGAGDWERLTVNGDRVVLETRRRGEVERHEFNRLWVRVGRAGARSEARVVLRYSGRDVEFGNHLPPTDRRRVARELESVLGRYR
jgi:uncharacterized membrane protein